MSEVKGTADPKGQTGLRGVLPAGTSLRGYELKTILGQGAFGITYRARDLTLGRDVAIKEYLPTSLALREGRTTVMPRSPDHAEQFAWGRERFLEEARTLARLDRTPAIVRVHDFLEANGTAYMVMALIEGETLAKKLLREQRLAPEVIERLVFSLLDGLEEVHAIGFLHRDIKPANIMLDSHGRPTLIDFGASRAAMAERSTTLTAIFTPGYAAAEQFTSTDLGPWTDIYGLAATLYHAITGKIPPSAVERILNDAYQSLAELQPEAYDPALLAGIDAGLAIRAQDRPRSIAEWRHVLRSGEALPSQEATHIATRLHRAARKGSAKRQVRLTLRGPALAGAIAAAVVALSGGGWLAWQASTSVGTVVQGLSAEQLEQALAERRKADALAAEKRQLEDEARQKAVAEAEAQRQAQAELEQAREARQKAEEELAELKARIAAGPVQPTTQQDPATVAAQRAAEEEAQRKAEAEAAAMRQAEDEAQKRLAAEAEARRQADEAVARLEAERQQAEREARAKAEAEQVAMKKASEEAQRKAGEAESVRQAEVARAVAEAEQKKAEAERQKAEADAKVKIEAEAAEKALRLDQPGRERLQLALTSLGFDTRGSDGILGPRSREMISAWQKLRNQPATGFLNAAQQETLLKEAAPALAKREEQRKTDEEAKKLIAAASKTAPPNAVAPNAAFDGVYSGELRPGGGGRVAVELRLSGSNGTGTLSMAGCTPSPFSVTVDAAGKISGSGEFNCITHTSPAQLAGALQIQGSVETGSVRLAFYSQRGVPTSTLLRPGAAALPALPSPDGQWRGTYACTAVMSTNPVQKFTLDLNLKLTDGISSGGGFVPTDANGRTLNIDVAVNGADVTVTRQVLYAIPPRSSFSGHFDGTAMRASGKSSYGTLGYDCTLALARMP